MNLLYGQGEMAALTRAYNWAATPVGDPATWSPALLTCVNMMLASRFPMLVFWGADLITFYNDAFRPSLGDNGKHPSSLGQPGHVSWAESWPVIGPMIHTIMAGGEAVWFEDQQLPIYRDGTMGYAYWTYSFSPLMDEGKVGGILVTCSETTKAVVSIQKLAESEERFRTMSEASDVLIAVSDETSQAVYFNKAWTDFTGRTAEELLSFGWLDLVHPEDKERVSSIYFEAFKAQQYWSWEFRMLHRDGSYHWLLAKGPPRYYADGSFAGYISSSTDITSLKENERQRQQYTEKLQQAIDTVKMGTWSIDLQTIKVTMSDFVKELLGLPLNEDPVMEKIMAAVHPDYHQMLFSALDNAIKNQASSDTEYPITNLVTGQLKWVKATGKVFADETGKPATYSGMFMDITERKLDEIRKNDFISMVSHELKTPLTSIFGVLQLLDSQLESEPEQKTAEALRIGLVQAKKMEKLISGFLTLSRLESGKLELHCTSFDMDQLVREAVAEASLTAPSREFHLDHTTPGIITADKTKIGAVLANLLSNAVKYSVADTPIRIALTKPAPGRIQVSIADEGIGISSHDQVRIFERFYRAERSPDKMVAGFGIGLYLSLEIIERHGGHIWVESSRGQGSVFHFTLPVEQPAAVSSGK